MLAKISFDKLIYIIITIAIIVYLMIALLNNFDFKKGIDKIKELTNELSMSEVYNYLEANSDYYYKIDGATYCLTKDELKLSLSDKFINNMEEDIIEAIYKDNTFALKYNKDCVSN